MIKKSIIMFDNFTQMFRYIESEFLITKIAIVTIRNLPMDLRINRVLVQLFVLAGKMPDFHHRRKWFDAAWGGDLINYSLLSRDDVLYRDRPGNVTLRFSRHI